MERDFSNRRHRYGTAFAERKSLEVNRHNPFVQLIGVEIAEVGPDRSLLRL